MKSKHVALCLLLLLTQANCFALWGYGKSRKIAPHVEEVHGWSYWSSYDKYSKAELGHREFHFVLAANVKYLGQRRVFDYKSAKENAKQKLEQYLATMTQVNPKSLNHDEQLAYWLNVYNGLVLKLGLEHYPLLSFKDIKLRETFYGKAVWDLNLIKVNHTSLSLNNIEHSIIRAYWDPRLTFYGINHGNISDPDISPYPFLGSKVISQLETIARTMINNKDYVQVSQDKILVSELYRWHLSDFGGEQGLKSHLLKYAGKRKKAQLQAALNKQAKIEYRKYDWSINDYTILKKEFGITF